MDPRKKKFLVKETLYLCRMGIYRNLTIYKPQKNYYSDSLKFDPPHEYCIVQVKREHSLDIAYEYFKKGMRPIVINGIDENFDKESSVVNSCEGFIDPMMNIRTSFNAIVKEFDLFPLQDYDVIYMPMTYIIRNESLHNVDINVVGKVSMITVLINKIETMTFDEYDTISKKIETIFQTACLGNNDVLILNDLGCKTNKFPVEDLIDLLNYNIYKYGHLFKHIIIGADVKSKSDEIFYEKISKNIIYPQKYIDEFITSVHNVHSNSNDQPDNKVLEDELEALEELNKIVKKYKKNKKINKRNLD